MNNIAFIPWFITFEDRKTCKYMVQPGHEVQKAEVVNTITGSRKIYTSFIELSKLQLYLAIQLFFIGIVLAYQCIWLTARPALAFCYVYNAENLTARGISPGTLVYEYVADDKLYSATTTRNEMPLSQHSIKIKYLPFYPSMSRVDNFYGNWAGFVVAYAIFFVITTMIFFIPNETMPPNSYFYFTGKRPWIHMITK